MGYGVQIFNADGFKQIDTEDLEAKTLIVVETRVLAVSQYLFSNLDMKSYSASSNPVLQGLNDKIVGMRPQSTNMYPCLITKRRDVGNDIDLYVSSQAAGNIEIVIYQEVGSSEYTAAVNALGSNRHGIQCLNTAGDVVFDADLFPPRVTAITDTAAANSVTIPYDGFIPYGLVSTSSMFEYYADGEEFNVDYWCYKWSFSNGGFGHSLKTGQYEQSENFAQAQFGNRPKIIFLEP